MLSKMREIHYQSGIIIYLANFQLCQSIILFRFLGTASCILCSKKLFLLHKITCACSEQNASEVGVLNVE